MIILTIINIFSRYYIMVQWEDLSVSALRDIARHYNKEVKIVGVSKLKKLDLLKELQKHLNISGNKIIHKASKKEYNIEAPKAKEAPKKEEPKKEESKKEAPKKEEPKKEEPKKEEPKKEEPKKAPKAKLKIYKPSVSKAPETKAPEIKAKAPEPPKAPETKAKAPNTESMMIEEGIKQLFHEQMPSFMHGMISKEQLYKDKFLTKRPAEQEAIRRLVKAKMKKEGII